MRLGRGSNVGITRKVKVINIFFLSKSERTRMNCLEENAFRKFHTQMFWDLWFWQFSIWFFSFLIFQTFIFCHPFILTKGDPLKCAFSEQRKYLLTNGYLVTSAKSILYYDTRLAVLCGMQDSVLFEYNWNWRRTPVRII